MQRSSVMETSVGGSTNARVFVLVVAAVALTACTGGARGSPDSSDGGLDSGAPGGGDGSTPQPGENCGTPALMDLESSFDSCPDCMGAHCLPQSVVPEKNRGNLASCDEGTLCVPDRIARGGPEFIPKECRSLLDAEGRCLSTCVPQVASQQESLPQASCAEDQRCAPCFNPVTGERTGACNVGCDVPKESKKVFDECCPGSQTGEMHGRCVPTDAVPESERGMLMQQGCDSGELCTPTPIARDQANGHFMRCSASGAFVSGPGGCVPHCFVPDGQEGFLSQNDCPDGDFLCAPCMSLFGCSGACRNTPDECSADAGAGGGFLGGLGGGGDAGFP